VRVPAALAARKKLLAPKRATDIMILEDLQHRYELLKPRIAMVRSYL
jgi:SpoU rRNA methylase family enzyme